LIDDQIGLDRIRSGLAHTFRIYYVRYRET